ncbi:MAG: N5-glutamine S-adenosyl-L-methionine-dependent methyltransferase [Parcubacteria group bacterium Gr01-1014_48]|nr:MAG: N5-glutamine S-adenosyl-L-methionine-dependent methyltransferase [Parcubacteria group bacterium Greene0416_14]TSC74075.1 MAG: N5-glutamine S-adenosyl-L-methionine-dependent methyltransferase [Parcubacteria group bacterium Gr01-1014_48]TSD01138.1 MAG: N5-glutamine S-adenosyl-L-methionine-dependent methyltransferase [Parcubacteria group bacterium Greene1014_15]TSD08214.1 MAG: N5-glutamine S-adenosyl-L-methionine-dependent methyltransferase [Parcubacteria group bacterium Greene0714_4]
MNSLEERHLLKEKYAGERTPEYLADCSRISAGEPTAYVIGTQPFLNITVDLSERPHIPRGETEFWTEYVIAMMQKDIRTSLSCLDIFAGSGCIGLAILSNVPKASVDFADIDSRCIKQIEKNLEFIGGISSRARSIRSDIFCNIEDRYDYILANPPYIALRHIKRVESSVLTFEPHQALFGGETGLDVIRTFLMHASKHLHPRGRIFMEFDDTQHATLEILVKTLPYTTSRFFLDQYGLWRFVELAVA